jgi:hypothetical protein
MFMRRFATFTIVLLSSSTLLPSCASTQQPTPSKRAEVDPGRTPHGPSEPTDLRRPWLEAELVREVRKGLEPLRPALGWDTPEAERMLDVYLPAALSERFRVEPDMAVLSSIDLDRELPRELKTVQAWIGECYSNAISRRRRDTLKSFQLPKGSIDPLPQDPTLRVVIALSVENLGSFVNSTPQALDKMMPIERGSAREEASAREERERAFTSNREDGALMISDALAGAVASRRFEGERVQILGLLLSKLTLRKFDVQTHLHAAELYASRADSDPWLSSLYLGIVCLEKAFFERGDGFASEVSSEQFARFREYLSVAYEHLTKAHKLAPHRVHAASHLVRQALGSGNPFHETPMYWLQQTLRADPASGIAFEKMVFATLDRWGGSLRDRITLLREMQRVAREPGGGTVGLQGVALLDEAMMEDENSISHRALVAECLECLRPLWDDADATTASRTGVDPNEAWSLALEVARLARDPETMWSILDEPGRVYVRTDSYYSYLELTRDWDSLLRWALERHPSDGVTLRRMNELMAAGDLDGAKAQATTLALSAKSQYTVRAARSVLTRIEIEGRLAAGETVDLLDPALRSTWEADRQIRAKCMDGPHFELAMVAVSSAKVDDFYFPLQLSGRYRVEMDLKFDVPLPTPRWGGTGTVSFDLRTMPPAPNSKEPFVRVTVSPNRGLDVQANSLRRSKPLASVPQPPRHVAIDVDGSVAHVFLDGALWDVVTLPAGTAAPTSRRQAPSSPPEPSPITGMLGIGRWSLTGKQRIQIDSIRVTRPTSPLPPPPSGFVK